MHGTTGLPLVLVEPSSVEWDAVSAYLGLCARSSKAQITAMWRVASTGTEIGFEKRRVDKFTVPCWISVSELGGENKKSDVCRRGFVLGEEGITVKFGRLDLPVMGSRGVGGDSGPGLVGGESGSFAGWIDSTEHQPDKISYDLLFCDVCVGVPYTVSSWAEAKYVKRISLPPDYDSLLVINSAAVHSSAAGPEGSDRASAAYLDFRLLDTTSGLGGREDELLPKSLHKGIEIRVFDSTQISPRFLVTVDVYPLTKEAFGIPVCSHCRQSPAEMYCVADDARLCAGCNEALHVDNKILSRHLRVPLNQAPPETMGQCTVHRQEECEYYCLVCETPICVLCKNAHLHGQPDPPLVPLLDAYHGILADYARHKGEEFAQGLEDSSFVGPTANTIRLRKQKVAERIADIDALIEQCEQSTREAKEAAHRIVQSAVDQLMYWCERNVADSLGRRLCQARKLQELHKGRIFIDYLKSVLPPADFLRHWLHHCRAVKELLLTDDDEDHSLDLATTLTAAPPLLKLEGSINIASD
ncbi:putative zinc finger protein [Gregarina niphandrodes]|uniref:Zinc finger protein n=1 Tax=Gregarina niphandrodes TaxID=110365 RepID=A0A023B5M8_GRENI|nr:putative zinc finger protein [Gregarina niphandrodes]EZG61391.1 putative zinc finger protein [Gregarina niphandrodes]|eukprot:XP_011130751.1 putative zinc finger protein [Gregarina niphandrodes]